MMIYFYDNLVAQTLEVVKSAYDCADVLNDLNRIKQAIAGVKSCGNWRTADRLNQELLEKYPSIKVMNQIADSIPVPNPQPTKQYTIYEATIKCLENDYYGILCGIAIKKGLIHSAKEFIKPIY